MYRNYRKSFELKTNIWVDLTSQDPKNEMHLAWKSVLTHLYTPDAIIIIYTTFQWRCGKKTAERFETEIKTMNVSCCPVLLCWALFWDKLSWCPFTNIIVMISCDWKIPKKNDKQMIYRWKGGGDHWAHMRTKAGYVLVKAFFFLTISQSIMADIIKKNHQLLASATI